MLTQTEKQFLNAKTKTMKTKSLKTIAVVALFGLSLFAAAKITSANYRLLKTDFLIHSKGKTQHFINSFIN